MTSDSQNKQQDVHHNQESILTPKMWAGMRFGSWLSLLARNRFGVHWSRLAPAFSTTLLTMNNSLLALLQRWSHGAAIAETKIEHAPIFIIGHWRSGTTHLHELMACDKRHTFPTTYECLAPNHCLLTEGIAKRWLAFLLPKKRLQDNMDMGWDKPQEDEFALLCLGARSPFLTCAFPNNPPQDLEYLTMEGLSEQELEAWKGCLLHFLKLISYRRNKRIVLKSPQHTGRIETLLSMFPDARFVYIVRDPRRVYASTVNMRKVMFYSQGMQPPTFEGLDDYVFDLFNRLHHKVEETRSLIPDGRFAQVRYEDLTVDRHGEMRRIYEQLELDGFDEQVVPPMKKLLEAVKDHQKNRYQLDDQTLKMIEERCADFIEAYGYNSLAAA